MADFKTHAMGAALVSGVLATGLFMTGEATRSAVVGYFALGFIGGLLPDIDSSHSIPVRITFHILAVVAGFLMLFAVGQRYSLVELVLLWMACYILIRHGLFTLFTRFTVHRGLIHSVPAAALFGLAAVLLAHRGFGASTLQAWLCGSFLFAGCLVHLLLDELYSVNLQGMRLKNSFGTAFSFGSPHNRLGTLLLYLAVGGLFYLSPSPKDFTTFLLDPAIQHRVLNRLLPRHDWFAGFLTFFNIISVKLS
ncbi:MAG: metal-dependent hydrolase [Candidatus Competibacteraceae bacterium]